MQTAYKGECHVADSQKPSNTLSYVNDNYEKLIDILEKENSVLIDWFKFNCMQANPDKFQAIAVGNKTHAKTPVFKIVI
jgi:hypothetical protein